MNNPEEERKIDMVDDYFSAFAFPVFQLNATERPPVPKRHMSPSFFKVTRTGSPLAEHHENAVAFFHSLFLAPSLTAAMRLSV